MGASHGDDDGAAARVANSDAGLAVPENAVNLPGLARVATVGINQKVNLRGIADCLNEFVGTPLENLAVDGSGNTGARRPDSIPPPHCRPPSGRERSRIDFNLTGSWPPQCNS